MDGERPQLSKIVLDHAAHPRHFGPLFEFDGHARVTGPCGDIMEFWVAVRDGFIRNISFFADGCGFTLASGSMAACLARGLPVERASALKGEDIVKALGGLPEESVHCAVLAATSLKWACVDSQSRAASPPTA